MPVAFKCACKPGLATRLWERDLDVKFNNLRLWVVIDSGLGRDDNLERLKHPGACVLPRPAAGKIKKPALRVVVDSASN